MLCTNSNSLRSARYADAGIGMDEVEVMLYNVSPENDNFNLLSFLNFLHL